MVREIKVLCNLKPNTFYTESINYFLMNGDLY